MAKLPKPGSKSQVRWVKGIWAGKLERDDTHVLLTPAGALSVRSVRRLPAPAQAQLQTMKEACGLPWDPRRGRRVRVQDREKSQVVVLPLPTVQPPRPDSASRRWRRCCCPVACPRRCRVDHEANAVEGYAQAEELEDALLPESEGAGAGSAAQPELADPTTPANANADGAQAAQSSLFRGSGWSSPLAALPASMPSPTGLGAGGGIARETKC